MKKKISMLLIMILTITMVSAGCSGEKDANEPSKSSEEGNLKNEGSEGYLIGYNNWGQGVEGLELRHKRMKRGW